MIYSHETVCTFMPYFLIGITVYWLNPTLLKRTFTTFHPGREGYFPDLMLMSDFIMFRPGSPVYEWKSLQRCTSQHFRNSSTAQILSNIRISCVQQLFLDDQNLPLYCPFPARDYKWVSVHCVKIQ